MYVTSAGTVPSWFTSRPLERSFLIFGDLVLPALEFVSISSEWVEALGSLVNERMLNYVLLWSENVLVEKEIFKGF